AGATHTFWCKSQFCQICHGVRCLPPSGCGRYSRVPSKRPRMSFRMFAVLAFVLLLAPVAPHPALAQENGLFTVSSVHVDASGASSTEALNAAIAQGRAKAFQILYRRLTRQADW